ncbi:MAG: 1-hydroxycarotenoid 3,4-desaturase CrtD [Bacteroidota bacterium]
MPGKKAVVIGSGIAGLAIAIRLAVKGYSVTVLEKNPSPGGKITSFENKNFHFDGGPSLFTQPANIQELFELAGEPMGKYFSYHPVLIACKYFFENGKIVNAYSDPVLFSKELKEKLNEDPKQVLGYLQDSKKLYNNIGKIFLNESLHKVSTWLHQNVLKALKVLRFSYLFQTLNKYNHSRFSTKEAVQIFNRFATYNGSNPYKAPAMLSLIPHLEHNIGICYPQGGMISIVKALYDLAKDKGVELRFNVQVDKIIHAEKKVIGVDIKNEKINADIIISNADIYFTYKYLLNDQFKANKILKQERSCSAVVFYWGINKKFSELELHNIFFSNDYENEFKDIFQNKTISADPTIYINITGKMEESHAPEGKENWFVMVNVPSNNGQDWEKIKAELRKNIIAKLNKILKDDIEKCIETENVLDPILIEQQTYSYKGSIYGTSSNSKFAAFLRNPNFSDKIKGLYFCGGTVHPGGGIPLCLQSAKIVSELITKDE